MDLDFLINNLVGTGEPMNVTSIANKLGVSERGLQKISYKYYGLPPKTVLRIKRLHESLKLATSGSLPSYSQVAIESGYYDQSHMNAEYQRMIGHTPKQLFQ